MALFSRRTPDADYDAEVVARSAPYVGGDGDLGVLLCHGFTGSPESMRPWGRALEAEGFRVSVPLLPGHGTTWQNMNTTVWQDWYATVDREFRRLRRECRRVYVTGLSMGGALALRLAEQHGDDVAALALVNPCISLADKRLLVLPALARVTPSIAGVAGDIKKPGVSEFGYRRTPLKAMVSQTQLWDDVRRHLPKVDQPILLFRSEVDNVVDETSAVLIRSRTSSPELVERVLTESYHVATLDNDAETIFAESAAFFGKHDR